jgi:GNAT superfamily N-acetyltransferase
MEIREAKNTDWQQLFKFYSRIYRANHPLQKFVFWEWQYNDKEYGRSFICISDGEIVGHVGANFGGGVAWIINVYLDSEFRGRGILAKMYEMARNYMPLAATAANEAGLGLYRNMRWIRYHDLLRFVKINPKVVSNDIRDICANIQVHVGEYRYNDSHYFKQPGLTGIKIGNFTGVSQPEVGGLRIVDFEKIEEVEKAAWQLGYNWIDFTTSWNDMRVRDLENWGWCIDKNSIVPWRLNPIEPGRYCDTTFLSEMPLKNDFIVHRSYSDHGRVGSL